MRSDLLETKLELNRQTRGLVDSFSSHREKVMQLIDATIKDLSPEGVDSLQALIVLGAGNCLDIELAKLADGFETIHLVDLDQHAVTTAVAESGIADSKVRIHAPVDVAEPLLSLTSRDVQSEVENPEHFLKVLQHLSAEGAAPEVPEADVVVSLCVLSQVFDTLMQLTEQTHPSFEKLLRAVRIGHLRRMLSMIRKGGVGILITDLVSSETAPELKNTTPEDLHDVVRKLVNNRNFFSGTNPGATIADLNLLSKLPDGPESVHTLDPWLWHLGERTYAVYGLRFQRKLPLQESSVPTPEEYSN